jgi:hypothetical protein
MWFFVKEDDRYSGFFITKQDMLARYLTFNIYNKMVEFVRRARELNLFADISLDEVKARISKTDTCYLPVVIFDRIEYGKYQNQ